MKIVHIILLTLCVMGGGVKAQTTNALTGFGVEVFLPNQTKSIMELQPNIDGSSILEFTNLGAIPLQLSISNSTSWNPVGSVISVQSNSEVKFKLQDLTQSNTGFLVVRNQNVIISSIGILDASRVSTLCLDLQDADGTNINSNFPGTWNSLPNLVHTCPKVNVGIGTSSPLAQLHIMPRTSVPGGLRQRSILVGNPDGPSNQGLAIYADGGMFARSIDVSLFNIPDYVFESDYSLMSLNDLDSYIQTHKHLPGIPSAKEVANNNNTVNLVEMNRLLLEKVEELTLYVIQLQKQIEGR